MCLQILVKIRLVGIAVFHVDWRTDKHTDILTYKKANSRFSELFCERI